MTMCRRFKGAAVARVIVSIPGRTVAAIDRLLAEVPEHPARGCRSEFVRLAIAEKLGRELMLSGEHAPHETLAT
jgi:hypothetical protein